MMNVITIEGTISDLSRTTHVSGGGEQAATTQHIALFQLMGERVQLVTPSPAMIADGDLVRLAGTRSVGQFSAIACKNLTTGWISSYSTQGCAVAFLIAFLVCSTVATLLMPLFIFGPVFGAIILYKVNKRNALYKAAHQMLDGA